MIQNKLTGATIYAPSLRASLSLEAASDAFSSLRLL